MECRDCKRVYEENVPYGFYLYQYERVLNDGTVVVHTQQSCKMCLSKRRKAQYWSKEER